MIVQVTPMYKTINQDLFRSLLRYWSSLRTRATVHDWLSRFWKSAIFPVVSPTCLSRAYRILQGYMYTNTHMITQLFYLRIISLDQPRINRESPGFFEHRSLWEDSCAQQQATFLQLSWLQNMTCDAVGLWIDHLKHTSLSCWGDCKATEHLGICPTTR